MREEIAEYLYGSPGGSRQGWAIMPEECKIYWYKRADQILAPIKQKIEGLRHIAKGHHYVCWASGTVIVVDKWGITEYLRCPYFDGDFNCGYRGCKDGMIKGFEDLTDMERHENSMLDKVLKALEE